LKKEGESGKEEKVAEKGGPTASTFVLGVVSANCVFLPAINRTIFGKKCKKGEGFKIITFLKL
jgi:hypothetical protein